VAFARDFASVGQPWAVRRGVAAEKLSKSGGNPGPFGRRVLFCLVLRNRGESQAKVEQSY